VRLDTAFYAYRIKGKTCHKTPRSLPRSFEYVFIFTILYLQITLLDMNTNIGGKVFHKIHWM